jgi:hypothetical protein
MNRKILAAAVTALLAVSMAGPVSANPMPSTEIRDPVRGVSFNSIEISDKMINSLDVIEGTFGDTDSLAVGLSALSFDHSNGADEYIFWLRHEGRAWLQFYMEQPVSFEVDGRQLALEQLRASQPFVGTASRMYEKVEFRLGDAALDELAQGQEINITLRSESCVVEKRLTSDEIDRIREFRASFGNGDLVEQTG